MIIGVGVWAFIVWIIVFGIIGALIGPRKGWSPGGAFVLCGCFGIFGIAYLATREDVDTEAIAAYQASQRPSSSGPPRSPIRSRTYSEGSQAASARAFERDATYQAQAGYVVSAQAWEGPALTVTYQLRRVPGPSTSTLPPMASRRPPVQGPPEDTWRARP